MTVSPFISLPSGVTLPYTYKSVPSSLPPSVAIDPSSDKPKFIVSASGHTAHPDDIAASCRALQDHIKKTNDDAHQAVKAWEDGIKERDLAEKRRVAPGWLDRDEKILEPTKVSPTNHDNTPGDLLGSRPTEANDPSKNIPGLIDREGEELDRAFGALNTK